MGPKIWKMQYLTNVCLQVQQGLWEMLEARLGEEEKFLMPGLWVMLLFQDENTFFRDVLSAKGKGLDARQKLEKMRNLKVKTQTYQAQMLCSCLQF